MNQSHTDGGEEKLQKPKTVKHYETFRKQTALPSQTLSSGSARGLDSSGALDGGELCPFADFKHRRKLYQVIKLVKAGESW